MDTIASLGDGGKGDGLPQEDGVDVRGGQQHEHDVRAEGGGGVPCVTVSGLVNQQNHSEEEFDKINIKKLISNWDAMAGE